MEDERIIGRLITRDESVLEEISREYRSYGISIAGRILAQSEDTEEIWNDVLMKLWRTIPPNRPMPLKRYIGMLCRQLALNRLEMQQREKRGGNAAVLALEELEEVIAGPDEADDAAEMLALREALISFIRSLRPDDRRIFLLRYQDFCSVEEIAASLSFGKSRVKMSLHRSRSRLKAYLEKEGFTL